MSGAHLRAAGPPIALVAAATLFCLPLLAHAELPWGSDLVFASHSAHGFVQALEEGVIYPRWIDNSNRGFGGPTFVYYAPLPYYAVAAASLLTHDLLGAFKLVLLAAALLSGVSFYVAARPLATAPGALFGAILYILLPYHTLDLYDRFAFAEYVAFIWFPLLFLFSRRVVCAPSRGAWLGLTVCFTGLLFTHVVTTYMLFFVLLPYVVVHVARHQRWSRLLPAAGAGAAAVLCAAVFVLPMLVQRPEVHLEWVVDAPYGDWRRNFVYRDEVAHGFRPALIKPWVNQGTTTTAILSVVAGVVLLLRAPRPLAAAWRRSRPASPWTDGVLHLVLAAWTFFLQIPPSAFLWSMVPELGTVQFPWRFGLFQALSTCFASACALAPVAEDADAAGQPTGSAAARWRHPAVAALVLALAAVPSLVVTGRLMLANRPYIFGPGEADDEQVMTRVMYEYLPQGMQGWQEFGDEPANRYPQATVSPAGRVDVQRWTTHERVLEVRAPTEPTRVSLRTFFHPGWRAWVDDRPTEIDADNPLRIITVTVPAGRHTVRVAFGSTWDRRLGAAVSAVSVATILGFAAVRRRTARRT